MNKYSKFKISHIILIKLQYNNNLKIPIGLVKEIWISAYIIYAK